MILLYPSLFASITLAASAGAHCRCRPQDNCWPSDQEWSLLNSSINGNLFAARPVASVCYGAEFNPAACKDATEQWSNSSWRASEPGAVQWTNWEAWPSRHEKCNIGMARNTSCGQGRVSLYSARVQSASDIQHAVRFARDKNLRVAIKASGHDFLGRSSAPESLQILTHDMKDISIVEDFRPVGAPKGEGPAATISAGVYLPELYRAVGKHERTVIAGAAHTVCAAGGYIQGGGHSPLGAWKGLGSDNALEFEVVTANGTLLTANSYQNQDLFWALRGGGGGTFGVVSKVTIRTFEDVPVVMANLNITTQQGDPSYWKSFSRFHAAFPSLNEAGGSGYNFNYPNLPMGANTSVSTTFSTIAFPTYTNRGDVDQVYKPLLQDLRQIPGVKVEYFSIAFPSTQSFIQKVLLPAKYDSTGSVSLIGSQLYSKELLLSEEGPEELTKAWSSLEYGPLEVINDLIVAGPGVARNSKIDSAVNPSWRRAAVHMLYGRGWADNATVAQQQAVIRNMTEVELPIIHAVESDMGAYQNEANAYQPDFQSMFWGDNYDRLYKIKKEWDPTGLFITRTGVGSEEWDDDGLCLRN